ncbi:PepSY-associated TM helix domain-containing protein [Marinoscillum sp.]|uniref:PepSY-associated TM helix domain-containing protein n=1 Tax=Marinoscillum sp. TaxID=2024838 RepID=UPI003BA8AC69
MSNRIYNILFHTHTVSGLVISVALYVIFFAGSISFFRDDIIAWERNQTVAPGTQMNTDYDQILDSLEAGHGSLYGRNINIRQPHQERNIMVSMEPSMDSAATEVQLKSVFTYIDSSTYEETNYFSSYTLGEFIYRLHFFAQIPYPYGYLMSGFVAFFFLFAIITGVIVHWKKIISNFYVFRPWAKLKTVWTDAHTALGLIGLPFQFVFAVTGAVLMIGTTVMLAPASSLIYKNDREHMYRELMEQPAPQRFQNLPISGNLSLNMLIEEASSYWTHSNLSRVVVQNYGDASMRVIVEARPNPDHAFAGLGRAIFDASGDLIRITEEDNLSYVVGADQTIHRLHFGDFGGHGLRIIFFTFGIISCFVILSGVLIWVEARDKRSNAQWKRRANLWVASIFMAVSLSMYPVIALSFSFIKIFKDATNPMPHLMIYKFFFITWLVVSLMLGIRRDHFFTTRFCLISGALLGFMVPIVNGLVTGNWMWETWQDGRIQIFVVDVFWSITSVITLFIGAIMKAPDY